MDQKLHLRVEMAWDPPHRTWNNDKSGLTDAGALEVVLLYGCPFNVNCGPWLGKTWLAELKEARAEYSELVGSAKCPCSWLCCLSLPGPRRGAPAGQQRLG